MRLRDNLMVVAEIALTKTQRIGQKNPYPGSVLATLDLSIYIVSSVHDGFSFFGSIVASFLFHFSFNTACLRYNEGDADAVKAYLGVDLETPLQCGEGYEFLPLRFQDPLHKEQ